MYIHMYLYIRARKADSVECGALSAYGGSVIGVCIGRGDQKRYRGGGEEGLVGCFFFVCAWGVLIGGNWMLKQVSTSFGHFWTWKAGPGE